MTTKLMNNRTFIRVQDGAGKWPNTSLREGKQDDS